MNNAILTTKLALSRWQQDLHHLATIVHLCSQEDTALDATALQGLRLIIESMRKEFKATDQLLDMVHVPYANDRKELKKLQIGK